MRMNCRLNLQVLLMTGVTILAASGSARGNYVFGPVKNLGPVVNGPAADCCPNLSADGLTLYFSSGRPGGLGDYDIWSCTRSSVDAAWGPPVNIGAPINSVYYDAYPCISGDGLTLYFSEHWAYNNQIGARLPEGSTNPMDTNIWMSMRISPSASWGAAVSAGTPPNSTGGELSATVSRDGLDLVFAAKRAGGLGYTDLLICSRSTVQEPWGPAVNCGPAVSSSGLESGPCLSADGLAMFFESCRGNDVPFVWDLWMTTRKSRSAPWGQAVRLGTSINTSASEWNAALSADGRTLYFASDRGGGYGKDDLYEVSITPVLDFNGDGKIDDKDVLVLQGRWGQADPLCDIGPFPWGDGVVDTQDLVVLMKAVTGSGSKVDPPAHATDVPRDVILSWIAAPFAQSYDVYFGTSLADVDSATRAHPKGVLISKGQTATTYDPEGLLDYSRTYWWRVDLVNAGAAPTIYKGAVLDFTTQAFIYPLRSVTAKASSAQAASGPEKTVDGSGLDASGGHSTDVKAMWQSAGIQPNWIQYEFDKVYKLHEMRVWNSNQVLEPFMGFGAKTVVIEYSVDGTMWTPLANVPEFARAPGKPGCTANTTVSFGGVSARIVKLTITRTWGVTPQTGLSEVRFFCIPDVSATQP